MGIENRESHRDEELPQIGDARDGRIGQSLGQRQRIGALDVGEHRHAGRGDGQCQKRQLVHDDAPRKRRRPRGCRFLRTPASGVGVRRNRPKGQKSSSNSSGGSVTSIGLAIRPKPNKSDHGEITPQRLRMPDILAIGPQREHKKQPAEHVAPLGHPGDRLDMQGMKGEQCRHQRAGPKPCGHPPQDQKQRHRRSSVQQEVGQVVSGRIQAIELAVEHVGKHRERIPLAQRTVGESPGNSRQRKAARDVRLVVDEVPSS